MKRKFLFLSGILISVLIFSLCNQNDDCLKSKMKQSADFELVRLIDYLDQNLTRGTVTEQKDEVVIKFRDEFAYEKTLVKLQGMSRDERLLWLTTLDGFNSLQEVFN